MLAHCSCSCQPMKLVAKPCPMAWLPYSAFGPKSDENEQEIIIVVIPTPLPMYPSPALPNPLPKSLGDILYAHDTYLMCA